MTVQACGTFTQPVWSLRFRPAEACRCRPDSVRPSVYPKDKDFHAHDGEILARNKGFITFMLCMVVFRSAVADWSVVPTGSMQPTIRIGDRILVDKAAYDIRLPLTHISLRHLADPQRGDIVVLDSDAANERLVKRVIGLPGDEVALRRNVLYVNGRAANYTAGTYSGIHDDLQNPARYAIERYGNMRHAIRVSANWPSPASNYGPVQIPAGQYLLLGDDRDNSYDSLSILGG